MVSNFALSQIFKKLYLFHVDVGPVNTFIFVNMCALTNYIIYIDNSKSEKMVKKILVL